VLECRIGIATGRVLVGNCGSSTRFWYTVLGSPVNLGSRFEHANKAFGTRVLICSDTAKALGDDFLVRPLPRCRVKGFATPQRAFELISVKSEATESQIKQVEVYSAVVQAIDQDNAELVLLQLRQYLELKQDDAFAKKQLLAWERSSRTLHEGYLYVIDIN
jgi:adenylate cyclase